MDMFPYARAVEKTVGYIVKLFRLDSPLNLTERPGPGALNLAPRRFVKIGGKFFLPAEKTLRDSIGNSKMTTLEHDFIEFALKARVLRFGEFKTKAGRLSPYFFNAGLFNTGSLLDRLGAFYAKKILEKRESGELQFDMLFGPAYKGIPLVASIAINLSRLGLDLPWAFNRKEKKDHGEGGTIIGSPLMGRVLIVDDVISAGTSIRESIAIIRDNGAIPAGVAIALDRMEKGGNAEEVTETSAVQDVEKTFSIPVVSIANLTNLLEFLKSGSDAAQEFTSHTEAVTAYRNRYGA
jgi:orotate phosphoribosyltransferase